MLDRNIFRSSWKTPSSDGEENLARALPGRLLLGCGVGFDLGSGVGILLGEAFDAARGVDQLLLASEERMAIGADFDTQHIAFNCRASLKRIPAGAVHRNGMIVGVNTGFH